MSMLGRSFPIGPFGYTKNTVGVYPNPNPGGENPALGHGQGSGSGQYGQTQRTGFVAQRNKLQRNRARITATDGLPLVAGPYSDPVPDLAGGVGTGVGLFTYFTGGQVQPKPTHPEARRTRARAVVYFIPVVGSNKGVGQTQPLATRQPRRKSARAVTSHIYGVGYVYGTVNQPLSTRQPRRTSARGIWRNTYVFGPSYGTVQPVATRQNQRSLVQRHRVVWRNTYTFGPSYGQVQPRPTVAIPRRKSSRAVIEFTPVVTTNAVVTVFGPAGTVQPQPTRQPRRTSARAVWRGTTPAYSYHTSGQTQPEATLPHQRVPQQRHRAVTAGSQIYSYYTGGQTQPRATIAVPRRKSSRAVTRGSAIYSYYTGGQTQPRMTIAVPRRYPSRAVIHQVATYTYHTGGQVQPWATRQPRRTSSRAWVAHQSVEGGEETPTYFTGGQVQPKPTHPEARRKTARAVWNQIVGPTVPYGQVQPLATRQPRRTSSRAFVKFTPVTTINFQPPPVIGVGYPVITWMHRTGGRSNPPNPTITIVSR
jgi:hypothetical protein